MFSSRLPDLKILNVLTLFIADRFNVMYWQINIAALHENSFLNTDQTMPFFTLLYFKCTHFIKAQYVSFHMNGYKIRNSFALLLLSLPFKKSPKLSISLLQPFVSHPFAHTNRRSYESAVLFCCSRLLKLKAKKKCQLKD